MNLSDVVQVKCGDQGVGHFKSPSLQLDRTLDGLTLVSIDTPAGLAFKLFQRVVVLPGLPWPYVVVGGGGGGGSLGHPSALHGPLEGHGRDPRGPALHSHVVASVDSNPDVAWNQSFLSGLALGPKVV